MTNDPTRAPQDQSVPPQQQNPAQQNNQNQPDPLEEEKTPGRRPPGEGLDTGVDTGAIQPGKTQGANLA